MLKRYKKSVALALLLTVTPAMSGCFGSFGAVKLIYNFNKDISGNKIVQWLVFVVAFFILPVYGIAGFIDVFILNVLEFWTGSNLLAEKGEEVPEKIVQLDDDTLLIMNRDEYHSLRFELIKAGEATSYEFEMTRDGAAFYDSGEMVGVLQAKPDGITLYNAEGVVLDSMSAAEEQQAIAEYEKQGPAGLVDFHESRAAVNFGVAAR